MSDAFYPDAPAPIRADLVDAQQHEWVRLAQPGTWWDGRERVSIAAEVRLARNCPFCAARKSALSPYAVQGEHDTEGILPPAAVEVIHRVTTDPQRLSRTFYDKAIEDGLTPEQYVELIGITVLTVSMDAFCRTLGLPLRPLPEAQPGEPSRRKASGKLVYDAFVPLLAKPSGPDADLYAAVPLPVAPNIVRSLSLVPAEARGLQRIAQAEYLTLDDLVDFTAHRSLDRQQTELISTRVSAFNECFY